MQQDSIPSLLKDLGSSQQQDSVLPMEIDTILAEKLSDSLTLKVQDTLLAIRQDSIFRTQKDSLSLQQKDSVVLQQSDSTLSGQPLDSAAVKKRRKKRMFGASDAEIRSRPISIRDYKIISHQRDTTYLDTTLTIQKEYKYNYLRKDDFELLSFANVGQPYNKLGVDLRSSQVYPALGAVALGDNYAEVRDMDYYNVATPMTDLFFKTTFEEGQLLDGTLTFNTSPRFNFSLSYKGFRSLGKYLSNQAEAGNFRTTSNYVTKNGRYRIRAHIAAQDIGTQANGGLVNKEVQFESGDEDFTERRKVDVRFNDADNKILGKRYYFDHFYKLLKKDKDSSRIERTSLGLGHVFNYETKFYRFDQAQQSDYFGPRLVSAIADKAQLKTMYNEVNAEFYSANLGRLRGNLSLYNYNYFFNSILITEDGGTIPSRLKGEEIAVGGTYENEIGGFELAAEFKYNLSGALGGNLLDVWAGYRINDRNKLSASGHASAKMPNFNYLLYQSDYLNYNWSNASVFEQEQVYGVEVNFDSDTWGELTVDYTTVNRYGYFGADTNFVVTEGVENSIIRPFQAANVLSHVKIKYNKEFRVGGFALNNTIMYQNVSQAENVLNVPDLVTRNTLYFSSDVFKKAMYIQTGITFKYFTAYNMDAYNPLIGEFYIQNEEKLGGFPVFDFFINAKVQQTRIYLKVEHFNSSFTDTRDYYAAPNYPYRDSVIRFGLVWNFFS